MVDYDLEKVGSDEDVIMAEQIRTVDKTRLRKYLGMLTTDFMEQIDEKLNISLQLRQKVKNIEKKGISKQLKKLWLILMHQKNAKM